MASDNCLWTAWGDMVCRSSTQHRPKPVGDTERFQDTACTQDTDCGKTMRCNPNRKITTLQNPLNPPDRVNNPSVTSASCVPCTDVGCIAGQTCADSSDCAQGLSCQANVCTVGSVIKGLNNSAGSVTSAAGATVGQTFEAQRQAYLSKTNMQDRDNSVLDCAMFGTCPQGYPCDGSAQCLANLMCDAGVCKTTYSDL